MNFLIGWMIGERVAGAAGKMNRETGNALWGIFWWAVISGLGGYAAHSNFGPEYGAYGRAGSALLVLAFCIRRPLASDFKMMMLAAISFVAGLSMLFSGGYVVICIGWAVISGELKNHGLSALHAMTLLGSCACFGVSFLIAALVGFVLERDRKRSERAERNYRQPEARKPDTRRPDDRGSEQTGNSKNEKFSHSAGPQFAPPSSGEMWWTVLQVDQNCTRADIEAAWPRLLSEYHPDHNMNLPPLLRAEAERQTKRILKARSEARAARPQ